MMYLPALSTLCWVASGSILRHPPRHPVLTRTPVTVPSFREPVGAFRFEESKDNNTLVVKRFTEPHDYAQIGHELVAIYIGLANAEVWNYTHVDVDPSFKVFNFLEKFPAVLTIDRPRGGEVGVALWASILQYYVRPYLPKKCGGGQDLDRLTIHLRTPFTGAGSGVGVYSPHFRQPPCSMYEDIIKHGENITSVRIIGASDNHPAGNETSSDNHPCLKSIQHAAKKQHYPVDVFLDRTVAEDACDVIGAHQLVMSTSSFAWSLALLGKSDERHVFGMLPCDGCKVNTDDPRLYYGQGSKWRTWTWSHDPPINEYQAQMCEFLGGRFTGFNVNYKYYMQGVTNNDPATMSEVMQGSVVDRTECPPPGEKMFDLSDFSES